MEREEKRRGEERMEEQSQNSPHTTLAEMLDQRDYERTQVPKIIGNYRLGKTLGVGAYCKVKVATHLVTKEKFAIKILQPQAPQNWVEVEREIEILQQIQHPNIIRIHDVLWSEGEGNVHKLSKEFSEVKFQGAKIYIVVELAQGGELWEHISAHGPLDEDMARRLFRQLVSGLEYCHMHLICHRDLKLENILLDKEYNVKINDFGLSNFIHPGHSMHTFCGTLAYAAPEILSQQAYVGFFVDIWSLGIILFAMLTGDVPWALDDEERKASELRNLLSGKFRLPSGMMLSHECLSLLQIMLQPNPKNRATLAQIRTHPWTNKGFGEPPPRVFENYPRIMEVEESILSQISLLGLNANKARRSILNNEPCPALCLYHTLLKKQLRSKRALPPLHRSMEPPRSRSVSIPPPMVSSAPPSPTRSPLGHSPTEDHQQQMLQEEFARKLQVSLAGVQYGERGGYERERGGSIVGEVLFLDPRARSTDFSHAHNLAPPKKTALSAPPTPTSHNLTSPPSPHAHTSPPSPKSPRTPNSLTSPPSPHAYSSPPSPTLTPHNPLANSLTSPRNAQPANQLPPRRKLSTMQLEPLAIVPAKPDLSPTAANTPLPPPLSPVEQEAKKEKKDPILRSLFNKFRGSNKLAPLEA